ncbi:MAG TPA: tyrosine-type recombinase/integrase [Gemmatimonadales bacterium]|nr:tyrosine-type recombinase/integrase [Gemmatimonadales bacterium]
MTRERYLSDDELQRFMDYARTRRHVHQPRDYAFFALIANVGLRPSEARALRLRDVHITERSRWIYVRRDKRNGPTPNTELELPPLIAAIVGAYVQTLTEPEQRLFPFTKRQSGRLFHYYGEKAGIAKTFRLYSLRHTCGMRIYRQTRDVRLIQAILGHSRLKASTAYVHVAPQRIGEAYRDLGTVA